MKIGKELVRSHMTINYEFPGIRVLDNGLQPTTWQLDMDVVAMEIGPDATAEKMQANGTMAFQKIFFWLDALMPGIVMVDPKNKGGMNIATTIDNAMLYCPGEPTDDILIQLFHSKLSAITEGVLFIGEMRLTSDDTSAKYTFSTTKKQYDLPKKVKNYCVLDAMDTKPWWTRDDGLCFEKLKPDSMSEEEIKLAYASIEDPLDVFEEAYNVGMDVVFTPEEEDTAPAEILEVAKWQPTTVE